MDVFQLRSHIVDTYAAYTTSFLTIADLTMRAYVQERLEAGELWPDALIQLSPAYAADQTVVQLAQSHVLHPLCAKIFGWKKDDSFSSLRLYRHQRDAITLAQQRRHYVVTTGTGSGKSLTYVVPIVDHILRDEPERGQVRAILVYPMNALINSQELGINAFLDTLPPEDRHLVQVRRYTGQESESQKREIQEHPPHILLTNYVMLELMLTRPAEFRFVEAGMTGLQFVVLDELHTYRGRQGADVAMLLRRLRERCGNPNLTCIGTSATMISAEGGSDPGVAVARVASTIFGAELGVDQVIGETLHRAILRSPRPTADQLAAMLTAELPETLSFTAFQQHPLAAWIEDTYSLQVDPRTNTLIRARPLSLREVRRSWPRSPGWIWIAAKLPSSTSSGWARAKTRPRKRPSPSSCTSLSHRAGRSTPPPRRRRAVS
ncbi:DEAD/DEAH box helicase [Oscillochloris sp. ZM17-4]|uniref:DEAD/DEAH box helicase n=1 Tax=Oscillochloris sp. ZM17-4 TaxID=2866714 RepID=UPI00351CFF4D